LQSGYNRIVVAFREDRGIIIGDNVPTDPRFIVDTMLGNLARWLRILGYDTLYNPTMEDWAIMRIAEKEKRVIITRDVGLYRRAVKKGLEAVLVNDTEISDMIKTLATKCRIRTHFDENDTRCPVCNGILRKTDSLVEVSGKVDPHIISSYKTYWVCSSCGKVYWKGKHWKNIEKVLSPPTDASS